MSESCIDGSMVAPKQLYPLTRRIAAWPAIAAADRNASNRRTRRPDRFAPENEVRTGLPAGGKRIRTVGPSRENIV